MVPKMEELLDFSSSFSYSQDCGNGIDVSLVTCLIIDSVVGQNRVETTVCWDGKG